ncbi:MAG: ABC transporter ATP-binding protein [Chroococcidiopsidaceae cyanobacterium CP_BM_RX_35]|nr:ABC transporter ATP-binding protein [Chroococcidiopsidaceae cyanobacterium CP_BM_RX_35]
MVCLKSAESLLLNYTRRYPIRVILTILLGFSSAVFNGASTTLIVPVLLNFLGQSLDLRGTPPIINVLLTPFSGVPESYRLGVMGAAIVLTIILKNAASYLSSLVSSQLGRLLTADLREDGLKLLLDIDLSYFSKEKVGDLVNRLGAEVGRTAGGLNSLLCTFITSVTILVFVALLLSISWQLTVAATILMSLVALVNQTLILRSRYFGQQLSKMSAAYSVSLLEVLSGIRLVKATGNEEKEYKHISQLIREREKADFQSQMNGAANGPFSEITSILALIVIVILGRFFFVDQIQYLSTVLLTYLLVLFRLLPFVGQLSTFRSQLGNSIASVEIVADFLRVDNKPMMSKGTIAFPGLKEIIHFNHIFFAYPGREELVLQNVDLKLPKGTTLALVGASGAGKSTIADLLPRFYDPNAGAILIDGHDIREFEAKSLRRAMGIVSQETFLFNDSIRNNIAYGCSTISEAEILDAVKRANAYEFIQNLPQGLETLIGDRGVMLSGGQRQRIAIARALLQNPEILILDEATSALDTISERLVQAAIDELSRDRTTLIIAHRLSTIQKADQIAVLDRGRVVEVGNHTTLLQLNGYYTRLYDMQFSRHRDAEGPLSTQDMHLKASYKARANLNILLGSLSLLSDGLVDDAEEQLQVVNESYRAAVQLLETLEFFEQRWTQL